jgi:hypothetical protein
MNCTLSNALTAIKFKLRSEKAIGRDADPRPGRQTAHPVEKTGALHCTAESSSAFHPYFLATWTGVAGAELRGSIPIDPVAEQRVVNTQTDSLSLTFPAKIPRCGR